MRSSLQGGTVRMDEKVCCAAPNPATERVVLTHTLVQLPVYFLNTLATVPSALIVSSLEDLRDGTVLVDVVGALRVSTPITSSNFAGRH